MSGAIAKALAKALRKTAADRYNSAGAFARALTEEQTADDGRHAIVVLPFANRSPDAENEYFSDGLTEEIIADLSSIQALSVISRTSAMRLKGTDKDVKTIGRELGVRYVLEGSVRKAGNDLRITAELIDAENDAQLWSEKYRGTIDDVFDLQERVSREIVRALDVTLTSDEDESLAERPIADARAYELYLKTRLELRRYGSVTDQASQLLAQAVGIEDETSPLRALMDWAKANEIKAGLTRATMPLEEAESQARAILEIAPHASYGYALLGHVAKERWDLPEAVRCWSQALERDPNDTETLFQLGIALNAAGQNDAAREIADRLISCDPLSPLTWLLAGSASWFEGHLEQSPALFERGLELEPENPISRWCTGYAYAFVNDPARAAPHAEFLREHFPGLPYTVQVNALVESLNGEHERALEWLASTDDEALDAHNQFHLAECYAIAGATERALDLLGQSVDGGFYPYPYIAEYCPFLAPLRGMPRFAEIAQNARRRAEEFPSASE